VEYDVRTLPQNTLETSAPVRLQLGCEHSRGIQQDLLEPYNFGKGWNVQWTISDGDAKFQMGGRNSSSGIVSYIKLFGFYEGGEDNAYRIDPSHLVKMLTSTSDGPLLGAREMQPVDVAKDPSGPHWWIWTLTSVSLACLIWGCWLAAQASPQDGRKELRLKRSRRSTLSAGASAKLALADEAPDAPAASEAQKPFLKSPDLVHRPSTGSAADEWARLMAPETSTTPVATTRVLRPLSPLPLVTSPEARRYQVAPATWHTMATGSAAMSSATYIAAPPQAAPSAPAAMLSPIMVQQPQPQPQPQQPRQLLAPHLLELQPLPVMQLQQMPQQRQTELEQQHH